MVGRALTALAAATLVAGAADARTVTIATWNIEHLRADTGAGPVPRDPEDFARLQAIAAALDADIVALQEVDGPEAAARVFDPEDYAFFFSDRNNPMRTGFAVRRDIPVVEDRDLEALALDGGLRRGTDITVELDGKRLRLLSVHLKSFCFDDDLTGDDPDCRRLAQQLPILEHWIDERTREDVPFIVLGDFNRRFDTEPNGQFFREIDDGDPAPLDLSRVAAGVTAECLDRRFPVFIDHIVLDEQAHDWLMPASFRQVIISEAEVEEFRLSDHCPIAVTLDTASPRPDVVARARELFRQIEVRVAETNALVQELQALQPELEGLISR